MIIDKLENLKKYASVAPRMAEAIRFYLSHYEESLSDCSMTDPDADVAGAIRFGSTVLKNKFDADIIAEAHKKFADIQIVLTEEEVMYVPKTEPEVRTSYNEDSDFMLYEPAPAKDCTKLILPAGWFVIFLPGELHAPCFLNATDAPNPRKVVVKVLVD